MTEKNGIDHQVDICTETKIGKNPQIGPFCEIKNSRIGDNCKIGAGVCIESAVIGNNVEIGQNCTLVGIYVGDKIERKIVIEDDARIGAGSVILPAVKIGKGALVNAGSTLHGDVPAYHEYVEKVLIRSCAPCC